MIRPRWKFRSVFLISRCTCSGSFAESAFYYPVTLTPFERYDISRARWNICQRLAGPRQKRRIIKENTVGEESRGKICHSRRAGRFLRKIIFEENFTPVRIRGIAVTEIFLVRPGTGELSRRNQLEGNSLESSHQRKPNSSQVLSMQIFFLI